MIRSVGIISRPRRADIGAVIPPLLAWLGERGISVYCDDVTAESLAPGNVGRFREELPALADMLIVLGGDGTLLAAARLMGERNIPILPVNLGALGFLTSVTLKDMYPVLEQALNGEARFSERVVLGSQVVRNSKTVHQARALNDAVLNKAAMSRMMSAHAHESAVGNSRYGGNGSQLCGRR
jgi:NAD+ kinase